MLKPIVEDADRRPEMLLGEEARDVAVRGDEHGDAGHVPRQQLRLVAGSRHRLEHAGAVADDEHAFRRVAAGVATREDHGTLAVIAQQTRQRLDHRRLARAADGEIADADDTVMEAALPPRARVPRTAQERDAPVRAAEESGQWIMRNGRTTPSRSGGSRSRITASVRSRAPRFDSTSAFAAAPTRARRTGSRSRLNIVSSRSLPERTWMAAPLARKASAISPKFCM